MLNHSLLGPCFWSTGTRVETQCLFFLEKKMDVFTLFVRRMN